MLRPTARRTRNSMRAGCVTTAADDTGAGAAASSGTAAEHASWAAQLKAMCDKMDATQAVLANIDASTYNASAKAPSDRLRMVTGEVDGLYILPSAAVAVPPLPAPAKLEDFSSLTPAQVVSLLAFYRLPLADVEASAGDGGAALNKRTLARHMGVLAALR